LRRVDAARLVKHLEEIAAKEQVEIEEAALALIARAAEGSVRDSLSLLDQAIAHAAGPVRAEDVRQMLGLADRVRVVDLFESLMRGDIASALKELRDQYDIGADPAVVLRDLAEFTHFVTRVKVVPSVADDVSLSEAERTRGRDFAAKLSMRVLSRAWQMLLKGVGEVQESGRPLAAAEMVMVRIAYVADLPTPDDVIRSLNGDDGAALASASAGNGGARSAHQVSPQESSQAPQQNFATRFETPRGAPRASAAVSPRMAAEEQAPPALILGSFEALIALAQEKRDINLKVTLERDVRLVRFEEGQLEIAIDANAPRTFVHDLQRKLSAWTGRRWMVVVSKEQGAPTLREQANDREAELKRKVMGDPLVQAVLQRFPGATVGQITQRAEDDADEAMPSGPLESEQED
jgi:DNA polymerase-3 subunit gamma/tau